MYKHLKSCKRDFFCFILRNFVQPQKIHDNHLHYKYVKYVNQKANKIFKYNISFA